MLFYSGFKDQEATFELPSEVTVLENKMPHTHESNL